MAHRNFKTLNFPGASLDWADSYYLLRFLEPLHFLSSAVLGDGFVEARWLLSLEVDKDVCIPAPKEHLLHRAGQLGLPESEPIIGLLTAVQHQDLQIYTVSESRVVVAVLATVGVSHGSGPHQKHISSYGTPSKGDSLSPLEGDGEMDGRYGAQVLGTINLVVLVDAALAPGALVRASTIATEAKSLALMEGGVKTRDGSISTGTPTDVTVVGHTGKGVQFEYSGSATLVGWMISHASYHAVRRGLELFNKGGCPE